MISALMNHSIYSTNRHISCSIVTFPLMQDIANVIIDVFTSHPFQKLVNSWGMYFREIS
jgi:hypothetical protein